MRCMVMWGLTSGIINSFHNSIGPPEMEINPSNTARGDPRWAVIFFFFKFLYCMKHTDLSSYRIYLSWCSRIGYIRGDSQSIHLRNATVTTTTAQFESRTHSLSTWRPIFNTLGHTSSYTCPSWSLSGERRKNLAKSTEEKRLQL